MAYERRIVDDELDELFPEIAAIALDGPKGVGKTATASKRAIDSVYLDDSAQKTAVAADPRGILERPRPLLIDEWQRVPEVWDVVRREADRNPVGGQFLLTGSATPNHEATAHSGAGRVLRLRMRPLSLAERGVSDGTVSLAAMVRGKQPELRGTTAFGLSDYVREITASGFPGLRSLGSRALRAQLDSYLRNIVDRDIPQEGIEVRRPDVLLDWLRAYAAATSTTASYSAILDAATPGISEKPNRETTTTYRDILTQLWVLDPVPAWTASGSQLSRLQQSPKHHLADPALAARLLRVDDRSLIDGAGRVIGSNEGTLLGALFESLVTLCIRPAAQAAEAEVRHLRTRNGDHEVDLVLVGPDGRVTALEVKLASTVTDRDVRHLIWLREKLGDRLADAAVISTGPMTYRRSDGIGVIPLALLAP